MDESAQQAVQLGVNAFIFIVALSLSINLMLGVRDVAEIALKYDASIPTGSRVVSVSDEKKRTISGYELLSYYTNYISEQSKVTSSGKFQITIVNKEETGRINETTEFNPNEKKLKEFLYDSGIDITKEYEVISNKYDDDTQVLQVIIKEI